MSETTRPNLLLALPVMAKAVREAAEMDRVLADIQRALDVPREEAVARLQRALDTPVAPLSKAGPREDADGSYGVFSA